jgi:NAD(P)H dehydrogenase (quinone)
VNLLIVFYSRGGTIETLANAVAEGALTRGAEVRLRRARELVSPETMALAPGWSQSAQRMNAAYPAPTVDDARWADGFAFGTPTRFGSAASELRAYIETLGAVWLTGELWNKPAGVFTATSAPHGGLEATALGLYPTLAHLGFLIVPTGYGHEALFRAATPYGAGAVTHGAEQRRPTDDDLAVARFHGERIAGVVQAMTAARGEVA